MNILKPVVLALAVSSVAGVSTAHAWVPIVDDIKHAAKKIEKEVKNVVDDVVVGAAAIGCATAAGAATGEPTVIAGAAGACAKAASK